MSHVARAALRDAEPGELVVAPEGSVDEHDVACGEPAEHAFVQPGQTGHVGHDAATRAVAEDEPTGLKLHVRPVQVARRVAARLERLDCEARPLEPPLLLWLQRLPLSPAVVLHDLQHRIPAPQRLLDLLAPNTRTGVADSRRSSSPAVWSISASVSSTPAIGGARTPSDCSGVSASSCCRASGEALTRNQGPSPPRIASDDCVRGRARTPARAASHVSQWQFH